MLAETCRKVRLILDTKKQVAARDWLFTFCSITTDGLSSGCCLHLLRCHTYRSVRRNRRRFICHIYLDNYLEMSEHYHFYVFGALQWLRRVDAGVWPRRLGFDSKSVLVCLVDDVALGQVLLRTHGFCLVTVIPTILHSDIHSSAICAIWF
jgi:hypothetical protein